MKSKSFKGWDVVAGQLTSLAALAETAGEAAKRNEYLNAGQRASLLGIAKRLPYNGVVIADEVGMGKTRIAVTLAASVIRAGGRVAILVPPGLGPQWQDELRGGGVESPKLLRSLWQFLGAWRDQEQLTMPWFEREVVLISHAFTNWRLGKDSDPWRWALLPALHAFWRKKSSARFPRCFSDFESELKDSRFLKGFRYFESKLSSSSVSCDFPCEEDRDNSGGAKVLRAAHNIVESIWVHPPRHPARQLLEKLAEETPWPGAMKAKDYERNKQLRPWLESAVGLGLGSFDLVIIDEAHKSRGDGSGLSRMIDRVILPGVTPRRVAMTATPVELDVSQWHQTLERIGAENISPPNTDNDVFLLYARACAQVRKCPNDVQSRQDYQRASELFQQTLSPYLLRRDKRQLASVQTFSLRAKLPLHAYRHELEIPVEPTDLTPAWRQAVCAAEALSIVAIQKEDSVSKRLRLTMGNGHGIAALLDQARLDRNLDQNQLDLDAKETRETNGESELATSTDAIAKVKRLERVAWWQKSIASAFDSTDDPLLDHPAILAAVEAIEEVCEAGEKVLVFGRYTLPLKALVALLTGRFMPRALDAGKPWAQAKVHGDEWPAIQAAHRQLGRVGALDRCELDEKLASQYQSLEASRHAARVGLLDRIDAGLAPGSSRLVFDAFCRSVDQNTDVHDSPLALVARALQELTDMKPEEQDPIAVAAAFEELIHATADRNDDADGPSENESETAEARWARLETRLAEDYRRPEGGFARLMYGNTGQDTRRLLQLAFNRPNSHPAVLVAQSVVGREGLNLHKACKTVILLHPEWNPGVVEQQVGRVDRVGSLWEKTLAAIPDAEDITLELPRIAVRPVIFKGTYDEKNWEVLRERWDNLRAQLHGMVISPKLAEAGGLPDALVQEINSFAPRFDTKPSD